jgi:predicted hydrocarbon binding protein
VPLIAAGKYLPNRLVFDFLQALRELIGRTASEGVWRQPGREDGCPPAPPDDLEKSVDFSCFSALCGAVCAVYGEDAARSILYRCGRAAFGRILQTTSALVGLEGPHFYASSGSERIAEGLPSAARLINILSDMDCSMTADRRTYRFRCNACPECVGRPGDGGICFGTAGIFRGALDWFGIDPELPVAETACGTPGCSFSVGMDVRG